MLSVAPKNGPNGHLQLHASTVVINGKAVAFVGPSGVGKSSHALALLSRGGLLLADDVTWLDVIGQTLVALCPPTLAGRIEARGIGILVAEPAPPTRLHLVVDLGTPEYDRLPEPKTIALLGHDVVLLNKPKSDHFSDAIVQFLLHGRAE